MQRNLQKRIKTYIMFTENPNSSNSTKDTASFPEFATTAFIMCTVPPNPENGFVLPMHKMFFHIGEVVHFRCYPPTHLRGPKSAKCLKTGFFEHEIPHCYLGNYVDVLQCHTSYHETTSTGTVLLW